MSLREARLGTLRVRYEDGSEREHKVLAWLGYGVVMPSLLTSNGSARMVADEVTRYLHGHCEVRRTAHFESDQPELTTEATATREALTDALRRAYDRLKAEASG